MRAQGCNLGGEQSGHMVLSDYATTGDGLIAALQVLAVAVRAGTPMSQVGQVFIPVPQRLHNIRYAGGRPLDAAGVKRAIEKAEASLIGAGRLVIRPSGTEPVIRVMAEADDPALIDTVIGQIAEAIEAAA